MYITSNKNRLNGININKVKKSPYQISFLCKSPLLLSLVSPWGFLTTFQKLYFKKEQEKKRCEYQHYTKMREE